MEENNKNDKEGRDCIGKFHKFFRKGYGTKQNHHRKNRRI